MSDSEWESDGICTPPQIIFADDVCDEAIDDETELDGSIPSHQITEIVLLREPSQHFYYRTYHLARDRHF